MKLFIATGSATYAQKANRVLSGLNIKNRLVKRQSGGSYGCGYGVELTQGDAENIVKLLTDAGVKIMGVVKEDI